MGVVVDEEEEKVRRLDINGLTIVASRCCCCCPCRLFVLFGGALIVVSLLPMDDDKRSTAKLKDPFFLVWHLRVRVESQNAPTVLLLLDAEAMLLLRHTLTKDDNNS